MVKKIKCLISNIMQRVRKRRLFAYGTDVYIPRHMHLQGHIECGSHVKLGGGGILYLPKLKS